MESPLPPHPRQARPSALEAEAVEMGVKRWRRMVAAVTRTSTKGWSVNARSTKGAVMEEAEVEGEEEV